ncbi:predicted protein [Scheffersomyces stipitis CBS 6054]|uniref:Uncharacterized protein n=1 Tax=Scheffersomyces stipitis (strain ATCC 58785 / CBS 6054 / NBRC 10063 / NRRL Y-11545) TaxID=322104 RepID=A3LTD0_PICST|nr:predicted protein [Scheffersomyces stipitis CBS 6054]ABN66050.2 predicted protein [Scheffersomyces stipitis CBS 6054]KAG2733279.1 hypothetical protein G9P44_004269 [Scheffersomyces stipitis]
MDDNLLEELEGLKNITKQPTAFKKKIISSKKSSQRTKLSFDDEEESGTEGSIQLPVLSRLDQPKVVSNRKNFQSVPVFTSKRAFSSKSGIRSQSSSEHEMELELDDDPENNPVVENPELLDASLREKLVVTPVPVVVQTKKYVPIETNRFEPLSDRQFKKQLKTEYADEYNYDDGTEKEQPKENEETDIVINTEDMMAEDEPLDLRQNTNFSINSDRYDFELDDDEDSDEEVDDSVSKRNKNKKVELREILTVEEQVTAMKNSIHQLEIAKLEQETKKKQLENDLETVRSKLDALRTELASL